MKGSNYFVLGSCFPAELGGPSNSVFRNVKELSNKNNYILTTKKGLNNQQVDKYKINFNENILIENVNVTFFNYLLSHKFNFNILIFILTKVNKNDSIHLNSIFYLLNFFILIVCKFKKIKYSIAPRGELMPPALGKNWLKKSYYKLIKPYLCEAEKIIVTSELEKIEVINRLGIVNCEIIPNFNSFEQQLPVIKNASKKNILYLGRLHPHKCIENLINAFIKTELGNQKLIIAGDGESGYVKSLKKLALNSKYIQFVGHVYGVDKDNLYKNSKLFILPSKSENFGNVVVESLYFGTPVVACTNSPWESLEKEKCGYFIDNSVDSLTKVILYHFNLDNQEQFNMELKAAEFAILKFSLKNNIKIIENGFKL